MADPIIPSDPAIYYLQIGAALLLAAPQPNHQERERAATRRPARLARDAPHGERVGVIDMDHDAYLGHDIFNVRDPAAVAAGYRHWIRRTGTVYSEGQAGMFRTMGEARAEIERRAKRAAFVATTGAEARSLLEQARERAEIAELGGTAD